jgi:hypothetical protein
MSHARVGRRPNGSDSRQTGRANKSNNKSHQLYGRVSPRNGWVFKDDWPTNTRRATLSGQGNPVAAAVTSLELTSAVSVAGGVRPRTIGSHGQILPSREAFTDPADSGRLPHPIGENGVKT